MNFKRFTALLLAVILIVCALPAFAGDVLYKEGDRGEEVMKIKDRMLELGYYTAAASHNQFNSTMTERVKQLQKVNGLPQTGTIDQELYDLIMSDNVLGKNGRMLNTYAQGDKGPAVKEIKERMAELLYYKSKKGMNNVFDETMTERVKLLQSLNGMEQTGVITNSLYKYIMSDACVKCGDHVNKTWTSSYRFNYALSGEKLYNVSESGNVIIFILDYFANSYLPGALREFPKMLDPFNDFTYYSNCDPRYIGTHPSITHMLTGYPYDPNQMIGEWFQNAWQSETANYIFDAIHEQGYEFRYYYYTFISNGMMADAVGKVDNLIDYSNFKGGEIPEIQSGPDFYEKLQSQGLTADKTDKKYIQMIHLKGAHAPYTVNQYGKDASSATRAQTIAGYMRMVAEYISQLKELGLYDDATIIITADHGEKTANMQVAYWIKQAGETHDKVQENKAPISHLDFPGTLLHIIGADYSAYGKTIFDWNEGDKRERQCGMLGGDFTIYPYVSCYSDPGLGSANYWKTYTYTGDAKELKKQYERGKYTHVFMVQSFN